MIPTITAFERSPDRGLGLACDMRVRWVLEEVGQPYDVRLVSFEAMKQPAHLALHLSARFGGTEWLDGGFSAGNLMMVHALLRLRPSGILGEFPALAAYVARGDARPAYKRAFDAQLAVFKAASSPAGQ